MSIDRDLLNTIIRYLQGTCNTLDDACETHGIEFIELTHQDFDIIDNEIFHCEQCGWWCEVSERAEDSELCEDCENDN